MKCFTPHPPPGLTLSDQSPIHNFCSLIAEIWLFSSTETFFFTHLLKHVQNAILVHTALRVGARVWSKPRREWRPPTCRTMILQNWLAGNQIHDLVLKFFNKNSDIIVQKTYKKIEKTERTDKYAPKII